MSNMEQVRKIICKEIKGYEGKRRRCTKMEWKLHRSSHDSLGARCRKKLQSKTSWFKKNKKNAKGEVGNAKGGRSNFRREPVPATKELEVKTVIFFC